MSKIRLIILSFVMIAINAIAVKVTDPEYHTFHVSHHDGLWIHSNSGENESYSVIISGVTLPPIPNHSIIDELFFKLNFSSTPNIFDIVSIASCDNAHHFNNQEIQNVFKRKVIGDSVYLVYNYVNGRTFDTVNNLHCWKVLANGDILSSLDINLTYHQSNPNDLSLRDYNRPNGYTNNDPSFTGVSSLSVISQSNLNNEEWNQEVIGNKVPLNEKKSENLVILIHGWNPQAYLNKFAPKYDGAFNSCEPHVLNLECSWYRVYKELITKESIKDDWVISRYDWSDDALTGLLDFTVGGDFVKANEARDRAVVHGKRLGEIVEVIQPKKVQFIAHSAGTWVARRAAQYLENKFGNSIQTEITMLDSFVIGEYDEIFDISSQWTDFQENIFVLDALIPLIDTDFTLVTSGYYNSWDLNLRLDLNNGGGAEYQSFMDNHSGPIFWYAETIPQNGSFRGFEYSLPYEHSLIKPTIESFTPTTQVISTNPTFKLYFSKNMLVSTLLNSITITGSVSGNHAVSGLNYIESEFAVSFSASGDFTPDETVTVQISSAATDRNNNGLVGSNLSKTYDVLGTIVQPPEPPANAMVFVNETIADGTYFNGNASFTKTWTLKNTGTNTWNSNYCLKHYNGDILSTSSSVCVSGSVATNQTYTFSVPMTAPASIATTKNYRDNWRLYSGNNSFSSSIWADINVRGLAAPAFNSIYAVDANQIQLGWSALADTNFYRLYRSSSFSGTYTEIMAAAASNFTDTGLTGNTTYYYKIKGCFDSQPSSCSGLSAAASGTTFPEAGAIADTIQSYTVSTLAVQPSDTTELAATVYNPSGIATLNKFQFVFALSDDALLGSGDTILYQSQEFTLSNLTTQDFAFSYTIPDAMVVGNHNLLACILYDPIGSDPTTSYCQSKTLVVSASPATAPPVPYKPTIDYTQGANQATISWNFSSGGVYYRLFRATSASGTYSEVYAGNTYSYFDNSIASGASYFYKLKSCANSLSNSCSALSAYSSFDATTTATNDFFVDRLVLTTVGSQLTVKANQKYTGSSISTLVVLMGFYLSDDTNCSTSSDTYLGNAQSTLSANDTSDREEITFSLPSFTNTGTWYICAIADYNNQIAESNESNNSDSITAKTEVGAPRLKPVRFSPGVGEIIVSWDAVPGNVSYRLERGSSPNGPFNEGGYIGTATSYTDGGSSQSLGECQQVYYRLKSCNGTSGNATCSISPIVSGYTLQVNTPAPTLNVLSDKKIEVSWPESNCADYYFVKRTDPSFGTKIKYFDKGTSFVDSAYLQPNTAYSYAIGGCASLSAYDFSHNGCSLQSAFSTTTTLASPPDDGIWEHHQAEQTSVENWVFPVINYKNKLWSFGSYSSNFINSKVMSSDDGFIWKVEIENASYSDRSGQMVIEFENKLFLIGGRLSNDSYAKDVWSSIDGINWTLINNNTPFPQRSSSSLVVFKNKMWIIGGADRTAADGSYGGELSDIWSSSDGITWDLITANAAFETRGGQQVFEYNNKLILIGGRGKPNTNYPYSIYSDIWSSTNGVNWILEKETTPFGPRHNHKVVKFNNQFWLFNGVTTSLNDVILTSSTDTTTFDYVGRTEGQQIWKSSDGINWNKLTEVSPLPANNIGAIVFNNEILVADGAFRNSIESANYGYVPIPPTGNVIIQGTVINNQVITADTSGISDQYTIGEYTYQWYINGQKVDGEEAIDFDVGNLTVGTEISVRARYTNSNGDLQTLMSDPVFVTTNPVVVNFSSEIIDTTYRVTPLSNTLLGYDNSFSVVYSSSNTNVATVSGTDENAIVNIMGLGSTVITALVTDTNNVQSSATFDLIINQAEQQISFNTAVISLDLIDEDFTLAYALTGNSTATTLFSSSNNNVATIDTNGYIQLKGAGTTFISVSNVGDANHAPVSATITLQVTDNFIIFASGFE